MSAPTSLISSHYSSLSTGGVSFPTNTGTMTTTTANQHKLTTTSRAANTDKNDLIECKFNELAKKILDELKQSQHSKEFFQALDLILNEPQQQQIARQSARLKLFISSATETPGQATGRRRQQATQKTVDRAEHLELKQKYELLMEKQKQQQEQLDSHQQILFDNQYKSLPSEITTGRGVASQKRKANTEQTGTAKPQVATEQRLSNNSQGPRSKNSSAEKLSVILPGFNNQHRRQSPQQQPQRSAIPTSTILSGIIQNNPLMKSATTGSFTCGEGATSNRLIRQSSLRLKLGNQDSSKKDNELESKQQTVLTPSEKIKQRRPTKASILDSSSQQRFLNWTRSQDDDSDDDNDDDDNDEDEDDYEYENLAARRAYLNQRFIQPIQVQQNQQSQQQPQKQSQLANNSQVVKSKTFSDAKNHLSVPANNRQQQVASNSGAGATFATTASRLSPVAATNQSQSQQQQQRQRFQSSGSQIARSNTTAGPVGGATLVAVNGQRSKPASQALVTSCKQKMQKQPRSVKISENNSDNDDDDDFDDDDEDDGEQPRSINGLMSSNSGNMISGQLYKPHMNYSTSLLGNHRLSDDDEIIIIPTAQSPSSLIMSASQSPVNPQQSQQQADEPISGNLDEFNERFSISRTKSFWEKLANSKKATSVSGGSDGVGGQQQHSGSKAGDTNNNSNKTIHHQHSTVKSAFDRLDSTGGSGNSHYSGCSSNSSTSGDEQQNVYANRLARVGGGGQALANGRQQQSSGKKPAAINPTINQLVQQDQLNRSDRFRQTR